MDKMDEFEGPPGDSKVPTVGSVAASASFWLVQAKIFQTDVMALS